MTDNFRAAVERLLSWVEAEKASASRTINAGQPESAVYAARGLHAAYRATGAKLTALLAQHPPETAPTEAQSGIAEWRCVHGVGLKRPCAGCDAAPASRGDASRAGTCDWDEDEDGNWHTDCGHMFTFTDDGPTENQQKFCGYCGQTLKAIKWAGADAPKET